jgi:hypothetical protein
MTNRRQFIASAGATLCALPLVQGCASNMNETEYDTAANAIWQHRSGRITERMTINRELVRYATLAPSSHNTQCWKFHIEHDAVSILPDVSRRCPAVDPDDHHLFVSLGCATENLIHAARAHGLDAQVAVQPDSATAVRVTLQSAPVVDSPLFQAIPLRQSTRAEYDATPLTGAELQLLERASSGNGVRVLLLTERPAMERVLEFVVAGNTAQMNDAAFVSELKSWIRFSRSDAVLSGDGLFSGASGNPVIPSWLGRSLFGMFFKTKSENDKYAKHVRSSAGLAVFVADVSDTAHWLEVGRCYERFALQSAALGIRNAFLNQPVEVPAVRPQFAAALGIGAARPDLVVRFGRGPALPRSMRRPVTSVLV